VKERLACGFLTCTDIHRNHHYFLVQGILDVMRDEAIISCTLYWSSGQGRRTFPLFKKNWRMLYWTLLSVAKILQCWQ